MARQVGNIDVYLIPVYTTMEVDLEKTGESIKNNFCNKQNHIRVYKYEWAERDHWKAIKLARYKKRYTYDKSMEFIIPLLALLFLGVMYVLVVRMKQGYVGFIILAVASVLMIYWVRELKKMARTEEPRVMPKEVEQKSWVYDLIKGNEELVFVAEVPGPEDEVNVRLINGVLHIRGGQNFARDVQLDVTEDMGIAEFKYRNGVLTLKIRRI